MKNRILFFAGIFLYFTSSAQTNIRLIIKNDHKVDNIGVIDISQEEFYEGRFKDTVDFKFNKYNVDLYNIRCFLNGKL